jgi:hypothetical protein
MTKLKQHTMTKTLYGLLIFAFLSCQNGEKRNGMKVFIENETAHPVTNIKFRTSEKLNVLTFEKINKHEKVSGFLDMQENKIDGCYVIEFTREGGKKVTDSFGYYTNGAATEKWTKFQIKNDTVIYVPGGMLY